MKRIKVLSDGILYRNPDPGRRAECAFLPNVVPLSESEEMCFYRVGSAFYSVDGQLAKLRSTDGGRTWSREGYVWDPKDDDLPYNYSAPHGARMKGGSMVLTAFRQDYSDTESGGNPPSETILFRSNDDGHTWSEPEALDLPGERRPDSPSQIIELDNGRWFQAFEQWNAWDDPGPFDIKGFALFSDDRGKSWGDRLDYPSAASKDRVYSHSRYARMLDGRIAVLQWTQEVGTAKDFDLHFTISDDTGAGWSEPRATGIMGQTSWLADLGDGLLIAAYTSREGMNPGIKVILSDDEGKTWDFDNEIMIWDAVGQEYLGVARVPTYPASHDNIAYGKPNTARLLNGEIICSWWCTQACVTHARFARIAVE